MCLIRDSQLDSGGSPRTAVGFSPGAPFSEIRIEHVAKPIKLHVPARSACAPRHPSEARYAMPTESIGHPPFGASREVFGVADERWRPPALNGSDPWR